MMRLGYFSERKAKKELISLYGKENTIKIAIGGAFDFLVINKNKIVKIIEVKETHDSNYYPSSRDKKQIRRIKFFSKNHGIDLELWVYKYKKHKCYKEVRKICDS